MVQRPTDHETSEEEEVLCLREEGDACEEVKTWEWQESGQNYTP